MATKNPVLGWQCKTEFPLPPYTMRLSTHKTSRGLSTRASVFKVDGNFEVHRMFTDYSEEVMRTHPARVTERLVDEQHAIACSKVIEYINHAVEHYAKLGETVTIS